MDEIRQLKMLIGAGNLNGIQAYYQHLAEEYEDVDWVWIFKECYLHACLKKQRPVVDWLMKEYEKMDMIQQIGVRQIFAYGRYLLAKP